MEEQNRVRAESEHQKGARILTYRSKLLQVLVPEVLQVQLLLIGSGLLEAEHLVVLTQRWVLLAWLAERVWREAAGVQRDALRGHRK